MEAEFDIRIGTEDISAARIPARKVTFLYLDFDASASISTIEVLCKKVTYYYFLETNREHTKIFRIADIEELEYRKVTVTGVYDHSKELFIGPRSLLSADGSEAESRGLGSNPEGIGWHVITPFKITEGSRQGDTILVNQGVCHLFDSTSKLIKVYKVTHKLRILKRYL